MEAMAVVTFTYSCSHEDLSELAMDFAVNVKPDVEGLIWKISLIDPDRRRAAGLYLFSDLPSASGYLEGSYLQRLRQAPVVSNVSTGAFHLIRDASLRSGAPLGQDPTARSARR